MVTVLLGVLGFTIVMTVLVAVLLIARATLMPGESAGLVINAGAREVVAPLGRTVLDVLDQAGVYIPSACGGQGTCGSCRVRVVAGGGEILPTETAHVTRGDARRGWRLACQVKIRGDVEIELPDTVLAAREWRCTVRSNRNVATFIKELTLDLPAGESVPFRAGGYVQVVCPPHHVSFRSFDVDHVYRGDWDRSDLWRLESTATEPVTRAYSMANYPGERGVIMLNVRIATPPPNLPTAPPGVVASYLFGLQPGEPVTITGPFGEFFARDTQSEMLFIGGGAGMAPMRSHIFDQFERLHTTRTVTFWYGARSLKEAFYVGDFDRLAAEHENFTWHLALSEPLPEDDWTGDTGFIHQVVHDRYLHDHPAPEDIEYYLCGPPLMIDACRAMLDDLGVPPAQILFDDFGT